MAVCESCGQKVRSVHRVKVESIAELMNSFPKPHTIAIQGDRVYGEEVIVFPGVARLGWSTPLQRWVVSD